MKYLFLISAGLCVTALAYAQEPIRHSEMLNASEAHQSQKITWEEDSLLPAVQANVAERMSTMTDTELAGAVLMPSFEKKVKPETFGKLLCEIRARSYIMLRSDTSKTLVNAIQKAYTKACPKTGVTLMVALDAEPSLMKYRMPSVKVPDTIALSDDAKNKSASLKIATALKEAGIFFNFAPVYDSEWGLRYGAKSFMYGRMYKIDNGAFIAAPADAFATTMWEFGIIPTAKHFPGHGSVVGDSHKQTVTIEMDGSAADLPEATQFMNAIGHGVPVIMVGHIIVKGGEWDTGGLPSTLSRKIMKDYLRDKLGYKGLVVTDSMAMGALNKYSDRSVKALKAGADLIVIPPDPRAAHARILKVMKTDSQFRDRVRDAVYRATLLYAVRER